VNLEELTTLEKRATPGPWVTWAGIARWSKENDSIFPDETHWVIAPKSNVNNDDWEGFPNKFKEMIGRIHDNHDQLFIARSRDAFVGLLKIAKAAKKYGKKGFHQHDCTISDHDDRCSCGNEELIKALAEFED